jgi:hypothetical protein
MIVKTALEALWGRPFTRQAKRHRSRSVPGRPSAKILIRREKLSI